MSSAARKRADPTVYREEDDMGEHELQTYILELLRPLCARWLASLGKRAHVGSDQFIYWQEHDPAAAVAPDLYVLPGVSQDIAISVWKVWEKGVTPSFALEVVGRRPEKDYDDAPRRYAALGVRELVVFDPFAATREDGIGFQVYRKTDRAFRRVLTTDGDRVRSKELGCHLRVVGDGAATRLRLATGLRGDDVVATEAEAERAAKEAERAAKEAERAAKEAERAAKEAALASNEVANARIAELERENARLRRRR